MHLFFYIQSNFDWIYCDRTEGVCAYVRLCVCVSVCVISTAKTNEPILMKFSINDLEDICQWHFSRILKIQNGWRHGGHFVRFQFGHSHGRNFASIFFKIEHKVQSCLPMFAIENQQNRSVTSGIIIENRVEKKNKMAAKNFFFLNQLRKVSISTHSDPLIANLIIFWRFD